MLALFKRPFHKESLDSWSKNLDDIARVAILAVPVVIYSNDAIVYKVFNIIFLAVFAFCSVSCADFIRKKRETLASSRE